MKIDIMKRKRIVTCVLLCVMWMIAMGITPLQAGKCEDAFMRCIHDPFWMHMFGSLYCANGYVFCVKYVK